MSANCAFAAAKAPELHEDRYVVLFEDESVGHLVAQRTGDVVELEYFVDNNGRGPKNRQRIELDGDGFPVLWRIDGESLFGDPVSERMARSAGRLVWTSQADSGELAAREPRLYIANDDSPWSLGLYARLLRDAENQELEVVPGGRLRAERLHDVALGDLPATAWRLTGLDLAPAYLLLDEDGRLAAEFSGRQVLVLEGYEGEAPRLRAVAEYLEADRAAALQEKLAHVFDAPVRIRNVRVFDPRSGRVGLPMALTVFDGRITVVEPEEEAADRPGEWVIDGAGGVLVPGLHDMHAHNTVQTGLFYLAAGVTSVRDMGNNADFVLELISRIEGGRLPGPRIWPTGFLEGRSPYSARNGIIADTLDEGLEAVRWYAERGFRQLKIYNSVHPDWLRPLTAEAHRLGMPVTGHVPAFVTPDEVIEAGFQDIAHVNQLMLGWLLESDEDTRTPIRLTAMERASDLDLGSAAVRRTLALMQEHGVALDTTAVVLELLLTSRAGEYPATVRDYVDHMPLGYQRNRRRAFVTIRTDEDDARYRAGFQRTLDTLAMLHEHGVQLLPGTDMATGFPVHRELELYVQAGIPAAEALALGTLRAAEYLGTHHEVGRIERGRQADFFLVPGDPAEDISALRRIRLVMKDGVAYFPSEIYEALGIRPFIDPVTLIPPVRAP